MTLWGIPQSVQSFREMQWAIRNDITSVLLQEGVFNKFGDGLTIYVRARNSDGELLGVLVHDKRKPKQPVTLMAERGALIFADGGPRVLLVNGNRQQVTQGSGRLSVLYFDSYTVDLATATGAVDTRFRDAREKSLAELVNASQAALGANDYRRAKVELHNRITSPLYNMAFALIALACLLTGGFNRRGQGIQIMTAIGLMVAVQAIGLGVMNLATRDLIFVPALYMAAILPIGLAAWAIHRPLGLRRALARPRFAA